MGCVEGWTGLVTLLDLVQVRSDGLCILWIRGVGGELVLWRGLKCTLHV